MSVPGMSLISASINQKRRDYNYICQQNKKILFCDDFTVIMVLVYYWNEKRRFNETKSFLFNVIRVSIYLH